jgi:uncharacterized protein Yka (UPF0111/DUF47 family)
MVSRKTRTVDDPLASRVEQVAELVHELRGELSQLRDRLADARQRIEDLEQERGLVRQRVESMLESIDG